MGALTGSTPGQPWGGPLCTSQMTGSSLKQSSAPTLLSTPFPHRDPAEHRLRPIGWPFSSPPAPCLWVSATCTPTLTSPGATGASHQGVPALPLAQGLWVSLGVVRLFRPALSCWSPLICFCGVGRAAGQVRGRSPLPCLGVFGCARGVGALGFGPGAVPGILLTYPLAYTSHPVWGNLASLLRDLGKVVARDLLESALPLQLSVPRAPSFTARELLQRELGLTHRSALHGSWHRQGAPQIFVEPPCDCPHLSLPWPLPALCCAHTHTHTPSHTHWHALTPTPTHPHIHHSLSHHSPLHPPTEPHTSASSPCPCSGSHPLAHPPSGAY